MYVAKTYKYTCYDYNACNVQQKDRIIRRKEIYITNYLPFVAAYIYIIINDTINGKNIQRERSKIRKKTPRTKP